MNQLYRINLQQHGRVFLLGILCMGLIYTTFSDFQTAPLVPIDHNEQVSSDQPPYKAEEEDDTPILPNTTRELFEIGDYLTYYSPHAYEMNNCTIYDIYDGFPTWYDYNLSTYDEQSGLLLSDLVMMNAYGNEHWSYFDLDNIDYTPLFLPMNFSFVDHNETMDTYFDSYLGEDVNISTKNHTLTITSDITNDTYHFEYDSEYPILQYAYFEVDSMKSYFSLVASSIEVPCLSKESVFGVSCRDQFSFTLNFTQNEPTQNYDLHEVQFHGSAWDLHFVLTTLEICKDGESESEPGWYRFGYYTENEELSIYSTYVLPSSHSLLTLEEVIPELLSATETSNRIIEDYYAQITCDFGTPEDPDLLTEEYTFSYVDGCYVRSTFNWYDEESVFMTEILFETTDLISPASSKISQFLLMEEIQMELDDELVYLLKEADPTSSEFSLKFQSIHITDLLLLNNTLVILADIYEGLWVTQMVKVQSHQVVYVASEESTFEFFSMAWALDFMGVNLTQNSSGIPTPLFHPMSHSLDEFTTEIRNSYNLVEFNELHKMELAEEELMISRETETTQFRTYLQSMDGVFTYWFEELIPKTDDAYFNTTAISTERILYSINNVTENPVGYDPIEWGLTTGEIMMWALDSSENTAKTYEEAIIYDVHTTPTGMTLILGQQLTSSDPDAGWTSEAPVIPITVDLALPLDILLVYSPYLKIGHFLPEFRPVDYSQTPLDLLSLHQDLYKTWPSYSHDEIEVTLLENITEITWFDSNVPVYKIQMAFNGGGILQDFVIYEYDRTGEVLHWARKVLILGEEQTYEVFDHPVGYTPINPLELPEGLFDDIEEWKALLNNITNTNSTDTNSTDLDLESVPGFSLGYLTGISVGTILLVYGLIQKNRRHWREIS